MWRRWGKPQNFFLVFIDELEKQIIIKKLLKWANKKQNNFNIYNVVFFKEKIKKNTCRYHYQNPDDMIYSSWDIEQNIMKLVILGHFLPFYPHKTPKIEILKNEKICWRYHHKIIQKKYGCIGWLQLGVWGSCKLPRRSRAILWWRHGYETPEQLCFFCVQYVRVNIEWKISAIIML